MPGEADPKSKAYHAKLEERTKHLRERLKFICGTSFHLEHSIGGGQGLVVSGEWEVAEASLQVDDQVGGAVERERGVTRKKREPAMDRSGTLFTGDWSLSCNTLTGKLDIKLTLLHEVVSVWSLRLRDQGTQSAPLPRQTYNGPW